MKKHLNLILTALLISFSINVNAKVHTVNNNTVDHPTPIGQYTSAQAAIDSAADGDTILFIPSNDTYGDVVIRKRLVIIGDGHISYYDQPQKYRAYIRYLYFYNASSSGSIVKNIEVGSALCSTDNGVSYPSNITYSNCRIGQAQTANSGLGGFLFDRCNITFGLALAIPNCIVTNCILGFNESHPGLSGNCALQMNAYTQTINNCLLFVKVCGDKGTIMNSVITGTISTPQNNASFINNVLLPDANGTLPAIPAGNVAINNSQGVYPYFVGIDGYPDNVYTNDLHLRATAAGKNGGTDSTDVGIFGGDQPMLLPIGVSDLPAVTFFNINNPVVPANGTINSDLKARKSLK